MYTDHPVRQIVVVFWRIYKTKTVFVSSFPKFGISNGNIFDTLRGSKVYEFFQYLHRQAANFLLGIYIRQSSKLFVIAYFQQTLAGMKDTDVLPLWLVTTGNHIRRILMTSPYNRSFQLCIAQLPQWHHFNESKRQAFAASKAFIPMSSSEEDWLSESLEYSLQFEF